VLPTNSVTSRIRRGADISFLSAFPAEKEILFALTYLQVMNQTPVSPRTICWFIVDRICFTVQPSSVGVGAAW